MQGYPLLPDALVLLDIGSQLTLITHEYAVKIGVQGWNATFWMKTVGEDMLKSVPRNIRLLYGTRMGLHLI